LRRLPIDAASPCERLAIVLPDDNRLGHPKRESSVCRNVATRRTVTGWPPDHQIGRWKRSRTRLNGRCRLIAGNPRERLLGGRSSTHWNDHLARADWGYVPEPWSGSDISTLADCVYSPMSGTPLLSKQTRRFTVSHCYLRRTLPSLAVPGISVIRVTVGEDGRRRTSSVIRGLLPIGAGLIDR
jgi:hypothetical protein